MHRFRSAFVITGFVILGLGSNLAWHYPRPEAVGAKIDSPQQLLSDGATLESNQIRCRPNADWSDLLVERADQERAATALKDHTVVDAPKPVESWQTPPALLADLAHLPGVKEANVVVRGRSEAIVMLSMQHGALAADPDLLGGAVQTLQSYEPKIRAENIKLLDGNGADLNYAPISFQSGPPLPVQEQVQVQLDGLLGPRQALFFCRLKRTQDSKIRLQSELYLRAVSEEQRKAAQELVDPALQNWLDAQNAMLKTDQNWQVKDLLSAHLANTSRRQLQRYWQIDRDRGLTLEPCEVKDWTLVQRTLPLEEMQFLRWSLTAPPATPGQLALGLAALAPALFGWCLAVTWLLRRHQLSKSAGAPL